MFCVSTGNKEEPSTLYEVARRKLYNDIRELYFFLNAELRLAQKDSGLSDPHLTRLSNLQEGAIEYKRQVLVSSQHRRIPKGLKLLTAFLKIFP